MKTYQKMGELRGGNRNLKIRYEGDMKIMQKAESRYHWGFSIMRLLVTSREHCRKRNQISGC